MSVKILSIVERPGGAHGESEKNTGRETFLLPVSWNDGWPMILEPGLPVPAVLPAPDLPTGAKPLLPMSGNFTWRDEFEDTDLAFAWSSLRGPPDAWLDLVAGIRYWSVDSRLQLGAGLLPGREVSNKEDWVDPLVGLKGMASLGRSRFFLSGGGVIGGFGAASDLMWDANINLGYRWTKTYN